jgi:hypothetical protein
MLWILEPKEEQELRTLSDEFEQDRERLIAREDPDFGTIDISLSLTDAETAVNPGAGDIHVLTHSGHSPHPWIGGLSFEDFAVTLAKKCGGIGALEHRTVWLLGCYVGQYMNQLLAAFARAGVQNVSVYAPVGLMFVSQTGIPHVHGDPDIKLKKANALVRKYDSDFLALSSEGFKASGQGWSGGRLTNGNVEVWKPSPVTKAVSEHFDPEQDEA